MPAHTVLLCPRFALSDSFRWGRGTITQVRVQTTGSTEQPVQQSASGTSRCVPYSPNLCFRKKTSLAGVDSVEYETTWGGTCLGGKRDVQVTACLGALNRNFNQPGTPVGGLFRCTVEDPIENGPKVSRSNIGNQQRN